MKGSPCWTGIPPLIILPLLIVFYIPLPPSKGDKTTGLRKEDDPVRQRRDWRLKKEKLSERPEEVSFFFYLKDLRRLIGLFSQSVAFLRFVFCPHKKWNNTRACILSMVVSDYNPIETLLRRWAAIDGHGLNILYDRGSYTVRDNIPKNATYHTILQK